MKLWLQRRFWPKLGATLIRLLGSTIRLHIHDEHGLRTQNDRQPVLFAFWHNRIFLLPYLHIWVMPGHRLAVMISRSRDGNVISNIIREFNMYSARGSSSRRGSVALLDLIRCVEKEKMDVAISPDGPRGPRLEVQPGILHLSRTTGCPIVPLTLIYSAKIELKSWDRFQIPVPFARCDFYFGKPITISPNATDEELAAVAKELAQAMGS